MYLDKDADLGALREAVRRFTVDRLEPFALEIDRTGSVPAEVVPMMREQGYLGMRLPESEGGGGASLRAYCLVMEELSRSHRVFTLIMDASSGLAPIAVARYGSAEQKVRYLGALASGSLRASFALTEPDAGSDSAGIRCSAAQRNGGWVLNGIKHYISGADKADVILVIALTDSVKRARGGMTAFLVDRNQPGFEITRVDTTMGSEAITVAELRFDDCYVPVSAVLGEVGSGFAVAMSSLTSGRLGVASACLGTATRLLDMMIEHARNRVTFGKPLGARQAIQWMIADTEVDIATARAHLYQTIDAVDAGHEIGTAASVAKLYCSEMVGRVADRAVQMFGGMGIVRGFPVERFYRDVRHYRVGEGASEIQRMVISRALLGNFGS